MTQAQMAQAQLTQTEMAQAQLTQAQMAGTLLTRHGAGAQNPRGYKL
jgi:hypothetical protein